MVERVLYLRALTWLELAKLVEFNKILNINMAITN